MDCGSWILFLAATKIGIKDTPLLYCPQELHYSHLQGKGTGAERDKVEPARSAPEAAKARHPSNGALPEAEPAVLRPILTGTEEAAATERPQPAAETLLPEVAAAVVDTSVHQSAVMESFRASEHAALEAPPGAPTVQARAAWTSLLQAWQFLMPALAVVCVLACSGAACRVLLHQSLASNDEDANSIGMTVGGSLTDRKLCLLAVEMSAVQ